MNLSGMVLLGGCICIVGVAILVVASVVKDMPVTAYIGLIIASVGLIIFVLPIFAPSIAQEVLRNFLRE